MTTTVSRLEVELDLDDKGFRLGITGSAKDLARLKAVIGSTNQVMRTQERQIRSVAASFRHTVVTLGLMREALRTAWAVSGGLVGGIVKVNAEFERLNVLLQGMSKGVTEIERASDATHQFNQVMSMAKSAPFTVKELTNSWVKFKSVGLDPADGSLRSLTDAVARFGGTDDILHRASIAVQQMAGKGVISMEELRQQMGEAVPQAMVLLARGMNMSVGNMVDAISKGQVEAEPALKKMFAEFDLTFGGAAQKLMETFVGSMARLSTVFQLTVNEIGQSSGLFEEVKSIVKQLIEELDKPAVRRFGIDIASSMKTAVVALKEAVSWIRENHQAILMVIKAIAAYRVAVIAATAVTKAFAVASASALAAGFAARIALFTKAMTAYRSITLAAAAATSGLGKAFLAIFTKNPAGWIILLVGAITAWIASQTKATKATLEGVEAVRKYKDAANELDFQKSIDQMEKMAAVIETQKKAFDQLRATNRNSVATGLMSQEDADRSEKIFSAYIANLEANYEDVATVVTESMDSAAKRSTDAARRQLEEQLREGLSLITSFARNSDVEIDILFKKKEIDEKQRLDLRLKNWKDFQTKQKQFFAERIEDQVKIIETANTLEATNAAAFASGEWKRRKEQAIAALRQLGPVIADEILRIESNLASISADNSFILGGDNEKGKKLKTFQDFVARTESTLAGLKAKLDDGAVSLAKFESQLASGLFGDDIDPIALEKLRAVLVEIQETGDDIKEKQTFQTAMKSMGSAMAKAREEAAIFAETLENNLTEVPNNRVRRFRRTFEALRATLIGNTDALVEFDKAYQKALSETKNVTALEETLRINKQIEELALSGIVNARERFGQELAMLDLKQQGLIAITEEGEAQDRLIAAYNKLIEVKKEAFENSTPLRRMAREWSDVMGNMEDAAAGFVDQFADRFVEAMEAGKFAFADFAKEVLREILRIIVRGMIARAVLSFMSPAASVTPSVSQIQAQGIGPQFAKGGIMTPDGPLKSYARGGIATKPQIALFGEGDMNEAFVPLPDGRSIPVSLSSGGKGNSAPNIEFNLINESGNDVEAEQSGPARFDGEGYVLDVVLRAANRPGGFRDGLKGAVRG